MEIDLSPVKQKLLGRYGEARVRNLCSDDSPRSFGRLSLVDRPILVTMINETIQLLQDTGHHRLTRLLWSNIRMRNTQPELDSQVAREYAKAPFNSIVDSSSGTIKWANPFPLRWVDEPVSDPYPALIGQLLPKYLLQAVIEDGHILSARPVVTQLNWIAMQPCSTVSSWAT